MIRGGGGPADLHGFDAECQNGPRLRGASPRMRKTASWLRIRRSTEYKVVAAMIATTWQARLRLSFAKQSPPARRPFWHGRIIARHGRSPALPRAQPAPPSG